MQRETKLYVVVRSCLSRSQRAVQAVHAAAEFMARYGSEEPVRQWVEHDKDVVLLQAKCPEDMEDAAKGNGFRTRSFRDSDLGGYVTAVAVGPLSAQEGLFFKHLRLA